MPDYRKPTHRKHLPTWSHRSCALWSSASHRQNFELDAAAHPSSRCFATGRWRRVFRKNKRWLIVLSVCLATMLWSTRSSLASAVDAAVTDSAAAATVAYYSNPALITTTTTLSRPVSAAVELQLTARLAYAAFLGAIIGKERSGQQHHPAGVRTMALVATGAACFTVCSMYGFASASAGCGAAAGRYDPSRMASNVASGVGFIGAGVITTTGATASSGNANEALSGHGGSIVHGLTTAAAIWLSAAVGVGCGVGMCILSTTAALLTLVILRIGRLAQKIQEKEWRLMELRQIRKQREVHSKPKLKLMRPDSTSGASSQNSIVKPSHIQKHHDSKDNPFSNSSDCVFEEKEDQFVFVDQRPPMGWNETDKMDA